MVDQLTGYFSVLGGLPAVLNVTDASSRELTFADGIEFCVSALSRLKQAENRIIFVGNGGSAAIASHMAVDYSKNGGFPALALNDGPMLTCLSNDLGYDEVFRPQVEWQGR